MRHARNSRGNPSQQRAFRRIAGHDIGPGLAERLHQPPDAELVGDWGEPLAERADMANLGAKPGEGIRRGGVTELRRKAEHAVPMLADLVDQRACGDRKRCAGWADEGHRSGGKPLRGGNAARRRPELWSMDLLVPELSSRIAPDHTHSPSSVRIVRRLPELRSHVREHEEWATGLPPAAP